MAIFLVMPFFYVPKHEKGETEMDHMKKYKNGEGS